MNTEPEILPVIGAIYQRESFKSLDDDGSLLRSRYNRYMIFTKIVPRINMDCGSELIIKHTFNILQWYTDSKANEIHDLRFFPDQLYKFHPEDWELVAVV
jgi:hypothetical protein